MLHPAASRPKLRWTLPRPGGAPSNARTHFWKRPNGREIDIPLLRKWRRDRKASGRAWARSQPEAIPGVELATHQLAKLITDEAHFAVDPGRKLYVFLDGVYVPTGEAYIKRRAKAIMIAS